MRSVLKATALLGVATAALWASAANAQDQAPVTTAADATVGEQPSATGVGDIIVTANRRAENQQKVPISVTAISGDSFRGIQAGGDDILSISGRVPGVYAETTTGRIFPRFYIRGLGNIDFYLGASQPVSIIQDDVVLEHVVMKSNPVFDNQQIEVLRGPQGTLFGRNTPAGIIKFDSIKPSFDYEGRASASYGSYNTVTFDAGVGGPITDTLAFRVSGLYQRRDDWVDNTFTGKSDDGTVSPKKNAMGGFDERDVRAQLLFKPDEKFSLLLSGHVRDYQGTATLFRRDGLVKGSNKIVDSQLRSELAYDEAEDNNQAYKTYGVSANATYNFGGVTLTSISAWESLDGYSRGDTDGGFRQLPLTVPAGTCVDCGESMGQVRSLDQFSEEVRLASSGDRALKWQIGGLYFNTADITDFYQRAYFLNPGVAGRNANNWVRLRDTNTSLAAFGQLSYEIDSKLTLTVGGRVTSDTKRTRLLKTADGADGTVTYKGRHNVRLSDTQPSFDFSALYQATPDVSVYARVATGFRGPTIQGRSAVFNSDFTTANSEKILSTEVGFKSQLFNDTLRFNASLFAYRMHDIQLNGNDQFGNGVLFNADRAMAYGAEFEADWRPVPNLSLNAGLSLLHSEIQDKRVYAQVCALAGKVVCTVENPTITRPVFGAPAVFAQIDGQPLPNAPEYSINLSGRYDVPMKSGGKVFIASDFNIQGYTNYVLYKTKEFYSNGNYELGAKIGYTAPNGDYEIALFARNLTDQRNLKGVIENYMAAVFNEPRIIGLQLSGKFR